MLVVNFSDGVGGSQSREGRVNHVHLTEALQVLQVLVSRFVVEVIVLLALFGGFLTCLLDSQLAVNFSLGRLWLLGFFFSFLLLLLFVLFALSRGEFFGVNWWHDVLLLFLLLFVGVLRLNPRLNK